MILVAAALVVIGVVLVGSLDGWQGASLALGSQYLGVALVLLAVNAIIPAVLEVVVAAGVLGVLGTAATASPPTTFDPRAWLLGSFRPGWFDLSVTAVAVVGALAVANERPVFGSGIDPVVDVLLFTGLLNCLAGRSPRIAGGLLLLASAGSVGLQAISQLSTRTDWFLLALLQIVLALALVRLRSIEEARAPDRRGSAAAEGDGAT
ncbi:MAG: hypothetical protein ACRDIY_17390 [Chloroflexota bacterium]